MKPIYIISIIASIFTVQGCGGSSSGDDGSNTPVVTTVQGQFFDSAVKGLQFTSNSNDGITDSAGTFTYELTDNVPERISFSIGNILLGDAEGRPFLTPMDLAPSDTAGLIEQQNIVRLLLALDADLDPNNGIDITNITSNADTFSWADIDFAGVGFETSAELTSFLTDASTILSRSVTLESTVTADAHINDTYRCLISGNYYGMFTGNDVGPLVLGVDPKTGVIGGLGWSRLQSTVIGVPFNATPLNRLDGFAFTAVSDNDFNFTGNIQHFNLMKGSWIENANSGSFSLERMATADNTVEYRFTGTYLADIPQVGINPIGALSVNILKNGDAEGELLNIVFGTTQITPVSGSVSNGIISLSATNGMTLSGAIDLIDHDATGTWSDPSGIIATGTFDMNGCVLTR